MLVVVFVWCTLCDVIDSTAPVSGGLMLVVVVWCRLCDVIDSTAPVPVGHACCCFFGTSCVM